MGDSFIVSMAIVDAGYISTAFIYFYSMDTGKFHEEKAVLPFGFASDFSPSLYTDWKLTAAPKQWLISPTKKGLFFCYEGVRLFANFTINFEQEGLNTIAPVRGGLFNYTYKNVALSSEGQFVFDGNRYMAKNKNAAIDFTLGYPPSHTFWNWACLSGETDNGMLLGINLVGDFNNGLENCLWLDSKPIPLGQAVFSYEKPIDKNKLKLHTEDNILDITFEPIGARSENLDLLFIKSQFTQPFGIFSGTLKQGETEHFIKGKGVVEEHFAVW